MKVTVVTDTIIGGNNTPSCRSCSFHGTSIFVFFTVINTDIRKLAKVLINLDEKNSLSISCKQFRVKDYYN